MFTLVSNEMETVTMCWRTRAAEEHFQNYLNQVVDQKKTKQNTESKEGGKRSTHGSSQSRDDLLIHKWIKQRAAARTTPYLVAGHRCMVVSRSRNRAEGHHSRDGKLIFVRLTGKRGRFELPALHRTSRIRTRPSVI